MVIMKQLTPKEISDKINKILEEQGYTFEVTANIKLKKK